MKTILALLLAFGASSLNSFGAGEIIFANTATTLISTNAWGHVGVTDPAPEGFYYGLFWAPLGTADPQQFLFANSYGTNTHTPTGGRFSGGRGVIDSANPGDQVQVLFRGWSSNLGHDWSQVGGLFDNIWGNEPFNEWQGVWGESPIATVLLGGGIYPPALPFGVNPGQIPGFTLYGVPEPTSFALAGLGAAALLILRRRE
jgi:hypothetical protein